MKSPKALTPLELNLTFVIIAILAIIAASSFGGTINYVAANTAQLSLSNLTTHVPEPSSAATNPTSVVTGATAATSSGQVAVDASGSETGVAMIIVNEACVMELVTVSKM